MTDAPPLNAAIDFARNAHAGQTRKDGKTPYIAHPLRVVQILEDAGITNTTILDAAALHDTIEDTSTKHHELVERFGLSVANLVKHLTLPSKDEHGHRPPGAKRAHFDALRNAPKAACLIKMADRLDNLRDWRGMDKSYKPTYALEGLRIWVACQENKQGLPYVDVDSFKAAWTRVSIDLFNECQKTLFQVDTTELTPQLEG